MEQLHSRVINISKRSVLAVITVLIFAAVLYSRTLSDAFLSFFIAGIVPGTNVIVEPDIMIGSASIILLIGLLISLVAQRRKALRDLPETYTWVAPVTAPATVHSPVKPRFSHLLFIISGGMRRLTSRLQNSIRNLLIKLSRWLVVLLLVTIISIENLSRLVARAVRLVWRWSLPYLMAFDTKLELWTRRLIEVAKTRAGRSDNLKFAVSAVLFYTGRYRRARVDSGSNDRRQD